jgi:hypothetical protein
MKTNTLVLTCLAVAVLFGGGGFYGGMQYAKSQTPAGMPGQFTAGQNGGNLRFDRNGPQNAGSQVRITGGGNIGEVISKDETSFTLKLLDGGSKIVFLSASTTVNKMTEGSMNDVTVGTNVTIMGTPNQDGSLTASQIQIRPNLPDLPIRR